MFDIRLRSVKDTVSEPLVTLVPAVVLPDHITLLGFVCGSLACVAATSQDTSHLAFPLWLINRALDCLDGAVARRRGISSDLGAFYDLLSDFVIYSAIPIAVAYGQSSTKDDLTSVHRLWLGVAFVEAMFHINNFVLFYCAALVAKREDAELTSVTMKPALIEGFESGLLFSGMLIWPRYVASLCWVMGALVVVGIVQRSWYLRRALSQDPNQTKSK